MCVYIYERHCNKCTNNNGSPEDEYHFVIVYNAYHDLRTQYISTYYYRRSSMYKTYRTFYYKQYNNPEKQMRYF